MDHLQQFIINHWQLCLALVGILLLIFINEMLTQKKRAKDLSPQAVVNLINHDNATVIDIRDKATFIEGHIIDAVQINVSDVETRMDKYKNKPVVLTCARGVQSASAAAKLRDQGFEQLYILQGGIEAWQQANLPLVKGKSKPALKAV